MMLVAIGTPPTEFPYHAYRNYEDVFSETEAAVLPENGGTYEISWSKAQRHHTDHFIISRRKNLMCCGNTSEICSNEDGYDSLLCWSPGLVRVETVFTAIREV